jgi:restriction system protein
VPGSRISPPVNPLPKLPLRTLLQFGLRPLALLLMVAAVLWLAASWWPAAGLSNAWLTQRPAALFLLGVGALLMWLQSPRVVRRAPRGFELSSFKHSTLAGDTGPDTHPVGPPTSAFADADAADAPVEQIDAAARPIALARRAAPNKPTRWRAGVLRAIEWQRFDAVCAALFRQDGYVVKVNSDGTAGGTQLWLHSRLDKKQPVRIVLCKHLNDGPIEVATVDAFALVLQRAGVTSGAIVTAGGFTDEAKKFARRSHMAPVDSVNLLTVILRRSEAQQQELLAVATQGEYWRPTCPSCNAKMVPAQSPQGIWNCSAEPACPTTLHWVAESV